MRLVDDTVLRMRPQHHVDDVARLLAVADRPPPLDDGCLDLSLESVADHLCDTLFVQDDRVEAVTVKIVKLAISEAGERQCQTMK